MAQLRYKLAAIKFTVLVCKAVTGRQCERVRHLPMVTDWGEVSFLLSWLATESPESICSLLWCKMLQSFSQTVYDDFCVS